MTQTRRVARTISSLTERWAQVDTRLLSSVFPLLKLGRPVSMTHIADKAGVTPSQARLALEGGYATLNRNDEATELFGVQISPTLHRVEVDGIVLYSCCPMVALMTPHFFSSAIQLDSVDPLTRGVVRVSANQAGIQSIEPDEASATFIEVTKITNGADIASIFCNHVGLFVSSECADRHAKLNPGRFVVSVNDLFDIGKKLHTEIWC